MKKSIFLISLAAIVALGSCKSKPLDTIENLKAGIAGETTASVKYKAFAEKARTEGRDTIARLFEAVSAAEKIHADAQLKLLTEFKGTLEEVKPQFEVKTTAENLQDAIVGEAYEAAGMYPEFIKKAKFETAGNAVETFTQALNTENKHRLLFVKALEALNQHSENKLPYHYYVCPVCGDVYDKMPSDSNCEMCKTSREFMKK